MEVVCEHGMNSGIIFDILLHSCQIGQIAYYLTPKDRRFCARIMQHCLFLLID